jgi:signal transduction histidine kinase
MSSRIESSHGSTVAPARDDPADRSGPAESSVGDAPPAAPPQPLRRERLIAGCRAAFAVAALLALWLDPSEPSQFATLAYALLAGYALLALLLGLWLAARHALPERLPLLLHAVDLGLFALLILVTDGPTSPFVVAFVFVLATAALRWQARGTLWTALAAIGLFGLIGLAAASGSIPAEFELNRFLIRTAQLAVLAILIGYLGAGEQRLRQRSARLADWPSVLPADAAGQLPALLGHAARALQAPRLLLVWEELDEPLTNVALWQADACDWRHEEPERLQPLAPEGLAGRAWFALCGRSHCRLFDASGRRIKGTPSLPAWLLGRHAPQSVLSVPLRGDGVSGRLYAFDIDDLTADECALAEMLGHRIAVRLDQLALFDRYHNDGLANERMRLAHDLHDGVIQSLAAGALRLESARQILDVQPLAASQLIEEIQDLLLSEQRELREFLGSIEPRPADAPRRAPALRERLDSLALRIERHWNLQVRIDNRLPRGGLPAGLDHQLHCVVLEALVNASRHGRASQAEVELRLADGRMQVTIADDGGGFPFTGRRDDAQLAATQTGPASIRRRVAALGGRLEIVSAASGATLQISLPLPPEPVA